MYGSDSICLSMPSIYLAADHAALSLCSHLTSLLRETHEKVENLSPVPDAAGRIDYPDAANAVSNALAGNESIGILLCGSGLGISMAANRHRHIRAAVCHEPYSAKLAKEHNNANVLCLGGRLIGTAMAEEIVLTFLSTPFSEEKQPGKKQTGRHTARIALFSN